MRNVILVFFVIQVAINYSIADPSCELNSGSQTEHHNYYENVVGFLNETILTPYDPSNPGATVYDVGIAIHIITDDFGNQGVPPSVLEDDLDLLLTKFQNQVKINFEIIKQDTIANSNYVTTTYESEEQISELYNVPHAVNIYYIPYPTAGHGRSTFSPDVMIYVNEFSPIELNGQYIIINASTPDHYTSTLTHEMGHYFDLFHIYDNCLGDDTPTSNPYETGDLIPDTPVADGQIVYQCNSTPGSDEWKIAHNFMAASSPANNCRDRFTNIQARSVRYSLVNRRDDHLRTWIKLTNTMDNNNAGGFLKAEQNSEIQEVPSGNFVGLVENQNATFKTLNERFENGEINKHHDWNEVSSDYKLTEDILVQAGADQNARFLELEPAEINMYLISANSSAEGSIDFHDPWFVEAGGSQPDTFITFDSPYFPTGARNETNGGVFLDQPYDDPPNPFYSVAAPQQPVNGVTYFLDHWSAFPPGSAEFEDDAATTTAVVFRDPDAVVTATMKGRMASNIPTATAYNNSRKIGWERDGTYHMAYEDGGHIWYTYTTNYGTTWSKERRLSTNSEANNSSPSIFVFSWEIGPAPGQSVEGESTPLLGVVWDRTESEAHFPVFRYRTTAGGWREELGSLFTGPTCNYNCNPVLSGKISGSGTRTFYVLLRLMPGSGLALYSIDAVNYWFNRITEPIIQGTTSTSLNHSMTAHKESVGWYSIHFAWEDNNRIYYSQYPPFSEPVVISAWAFTGEDHYPSITHDAVDKIDVVWQHDEGSATFRHRRGETDGENWEPIREVGCGGCHDGSIPSVGAYAESGSGELAAAVQIESFVQLLSFDGEEWDVTVDNYAGSNACLTDFGTDLQAVWTSDNAEPPFLIEHQVFPAPGAFGPRSGFVAKNYRKEMFRLSGLPSLNSKGDVELSYGDIQIQQTSGIRNWRFRQIKDTLNFRNFLQTTPLTITNDMQSLIIPYRVNVENCQLPKNPPSFPLFLIRLIDNANGNQLALLKSMDLNNLTGSSFHLEDTLTVDLAQFNSKEIVLQMRTLTHLLSNRKPSQIDVKEFHHATPTENILLTNGPPTESPVSVPAEFGLAQNYPNPFNPTTQISFLLPEPQLVTLEVYDITGRKIRTLINQLMEAGHHQILWDSKTDLGEQVSSGVYIYQIKAGSFSANRKMMLLR